MYDVVIGVDPGNSGGITIIENGGKISVFQMPIKTVKKVKKLKKEYDLQSIVALLKPFSGKNVLFVLERVATRPGEGNSSGFNFGVGYGELQGIAVALGFHLELVSPPVWKKDFSQLATLLFQKLKGQAKDLQDSLKSLKEKAPKQKYKTEVKQLKTEIAKLFREQKEEAKKAARELAASLQPSLASSFKLCKDDGKAESLLIAIFGKAHF